MEIDRDVQEREAAGGQLLVDGFVPTLYRQPSLAEGRLKPSPYRRVRPAHHHRQSQPPRTGSSEKTQGNSSTDRASRGGSNKSDALSLSFLLEDSDDSDSEDYNEIEVEVNDLLTGAGDKREDSGDSDSAGDKDYPSLTTPILDDLEVCKGFRIFCLHSIHCLLNFLSLSLYIYICIYMYVMHPQGLSSGNKVNYGSTSPEATPCEISL